MEKETDILETTREEDSNSNPIQIAIDFVLNADAYEKRSLPNNYLEEILFHYVLEKSKMFPNYIIPVSVQYFFMDEGEERKLLAQVPSSKNLVALPNPMLDGLYLKVDSSFDEKEKMINLYLHSKIQPYRSGKELDYSYFDMYYKKIIVYMANYRPYLYIDNMVVAAMVNSSLEFDWQLFYSNLWDWKVGFVDKELRENLACQIQDFQQWIDGAKMLEEQKTLKKQL